MSFFTDPKYAEASNNTRNNTSHDDDNVSAISDDNTASSKLSILSQTWMILQGKSPTIPEEAGSDEEGNAIIGLQVSGSRSANLNSANGGGEDTTAEHDNGGGGGGDDIADDGSASIVKWKPQLTEEAPYQSPPAINFLEDDPRSMTYGRRLALFLAKRYGWYNPRLKIPDGELIPEEETESAGDSLHPILQASIRGEDLLHADTPPGSALQAATHDRTAAMLLDAYPFTRSRRENPSIQKAWAYFDHVALSRYVVREKPGAAKKNFLVRCLRRFFCKGSQQLQRAEPGERDFPTALYKPIFTPHNQLGDFGLGIGLYFSTLRALTVLTLLAGLINLPNMYYYESSLYTPGESNFNSFLNKTVPNFMLKGTAVCRDVSWVVCLDCPSKNFSDTRLATQAVLKNSSVERNLTGADVPFFLKNNCDQSDIQASMFNYGTLLFVMVGTIVLNMYLRRMEIAYDEDEQTAQDYSIVIENPPGDATHPQEWHDFFREAFDGAHVTCCTVAVDNDLLVRSLVERREKLRQIEMMLQPGTSLDTLTLAGIAAKEERERRFWGTLKAYFVAGIPELFARVTVLTAKVQGLAQQDYPASNVFVTFETEAAQRAVLTALNLGSLDIKRNNTLAVNPKHLFRGKHVLKVTEPDEPNTVRWQDLNEKWKERLKQQMLTTVATLVAIVCIAFLIKVLNKAAVGSTAFTIAAFNSVFPMFAKMLTDFEAHSSEGGKQRSLYFKIALFRWVNTAVVFTIVVPFTSTLEDGALIARIYALFFAEM
jgi:Calcium-activated chloride channel